MKRIRYNIAPDRKIRVGRLVFLVAVMWVLTLLFFAIGLGQISSKKRQGRVEENELAVLEEKLSDVSEMAEDYQKKIGQLKKGWSKKIAFSNSMIRQKGFSFYDILNTLEERLLPDMFFSSLTVSSDSGAWINANVIATSFRKMAEFYDKFSPDNLVINKESLQSNRMVNASLSIKLPDEKN